MLFYFVMTTTGITDYSTQGQTHLTADNGTTVNVDGLPGDEASI